MNNRTIIDFGPYKGQRVENIPPGWMLWQYWNNGPQDELDAYVEKNLNQLESLNKNIMELKLEDLRIGNLVYDNIAEKMKTITVYDMVKINNGESLNLVPWKLDPRVLSKLGFMRDNGTNSHSYLSPKSDDGFRLRVESDMSFSPNKFRTIKIPFVHKLQNLFHVYCSEELPLPSFAVHG